MPRKEEGRAGEREEKAPERIRDIPSMKRMAQEAEEMHMLLPFLGSQDQEKIGSGLRALDFNIPDEFNAMFAERGFIYKKRVWVESPRIYPWDAEPRPPEGWRC